MASANTRVENAKIDRTMLGVEDHGILTAFIYLSGPGWGIGFGGRVFGATSGYCGAWIRAVLDTVGVGEWEDLPGKYVRVELVDERCGRLGHITEDRWFDPEALAQQKEYARV